MHVTRDGIVKQLCRRYSSLLVERPAKTYMQVHETRNDLRG